MGQLFFGLSFDFPNEFKLWWQKATEKDKRETFSKISMTALFDLILQFRTISILLLMETTDKNVPKLKGNRGKDKNCLVYLLNWFELSLQFHRLL